MATLEVTVPADSQNIFGVVRIQAPLDKVFRAYTDETLFAKWSLSRLVEQE